MECTVPSIEAFERGDGSAKGALFAGLYSELRRVARRELARHVRVSLSPTTLEHEAYLDMAGFDITSIGAEENIADDREFMRISRRYRTCSAAAMGEKARIYLHSSMRADLSS